MPTYVYACSCGYGHEKFEAMTPAPQPRKCPACSKRTLKRQIGAGVAADAKLKFAGMYPYESARLPLKMKGCERYGKMGQPIIESAKHERELIASSEGNWTRD